MTDGKITPQGQYEAAIATEYVAAMRICRRCAPRENSDWTLDDRIEFERAEAVANIMFDLLNRFISFRDKATPIFDDNVLLSASEFTEVVTQRTGIEITRERIAYACRTGYLAASHMGPRGDYAIPSRELEKYLRDDSSKIGPVWEAIGR